MNPTTLISPDSGTSERDRQERARKRKEADVAVAELHKLVASFKPDDYHWRLQGDKEFTLPFDVTPDMLCLTWDPTHHTLLDRTLYQAALALVSASQPSQRQLWAAYNRAEQLVNAAKKPPASPPEEQRAKLRAVTKSLARTVPFTMSELAVVDSEPTFMEHIAVLKDRAGLGIRTLNNAMKKRKPNLAMSSSGLGELLSRDRIPVGEPFVRLLVEVLLDHIDEANSTDKAVEEHLKVWRMLLRQRHQNGNLRSSLTRRYLAHLDAVARGASGDQRDAFDAARDIFLNTMRELRNDDVPQFAQYQQAPDAEHRAAG